MTAHATPVSGFDDEYDDREPSDATLAVQRTGRLAHVTITPFYSGRPGEPMVLQLPTEAFDAL